MLAFDLPPPAIIQAAEPWQLSLSADMAARGVPRQVRRAVIAEVKRLQGLPARYLRPAVLRPTLADLARYAGDPLLAMMPGMIPVIAGGAPAVQTYLGSASSTADAITYDFGNFTATNGLMIVAAAGRTSSASVARSLDVASIGGTNGTVHASTGTSLRGGSLGIGSRAVAAGATNVTVTWSGTCLRSAVFVWMLTGYLSETPTDTDVQWDDTNRTSFAATIDLPAGGVAVYVSMHNNTNATTWSAAGSTDDLSIESATRLSAASVSVVGAEAGHVETASWTGSVGLSGIVAVAWR